MIHNGIIENYLELKKDLIEQGSRLQERDGHRGHRPPGRGRVQESPTTLFRRRSRESGSLKGQYAIVLMFSDHPEMLIGARNDAPLVIGVGKRERFLASDVLAFISRTDRAVFLDNKEVAELTPEGFKVFNVRGKRG